MLEPAPPVPPPPDESDQITQAAPAGKSRPDNPKFFRWLCYVEFGVVCLITLGIVALIGYLFCWIVWELRPDVHKRVVETIKGLNIGWKIALGVFIPLFFRPAAKFLIHLKKAHGWETGEPAQGKESASQDYKGDR